MMPNRLSRHPYTNSILRNAKNMHNILKRYVYIENILTNTIYCHYINIFQKVLKYIDE